MWSTIAEKSYSYSFDDTATDVFVKAEIICDDRGNLDLKIIKSKSSPYIKNGKTEEERVYDIGTVLKPKLALIISLTKSTGTYGFPRNWTSWNGEQTNLSTIIQKWMKYKNIGVNSNSEEQIKKTLIDKINSMSKSELEQMSKMLRISSIQSDLVKIAKELKF